MPLHNEDQDKRPARIYSQDTLYIRQDLATKAMHTYALQQAVEFGSWLANKYEGIEIGLFRCKINKTYHTTSDLYKLFTQQNQK